MTEAWQEDASYQPIPYPERFDYPDAEMIARAGAFHAAMKKRHTVREFSDRPVPREVIETCLLTAGLAPNGANRQPWHFAVLGPGEKRRLIRQKAEAEEREFYAGRAGREWLDALKPLGTDPAKPFLETAPWLIVVFAQRYDLSPDGEKRKNYYVTESVGIACGFLVTALHNAGLVSLTHTPSPMGFLNQICGRPENEKPLMIVVAGHPAADATIPKEALNKKSLEEMASFF
ncbi:MAG: nitroreductase family protein [Proteobacteria bacterium]|nr:nitroreductase family protein [Pseudomonadota bacterium]